MIYLTDYLDILGIEMTIKYYPNQNCRWSAGFLYTNVEFKDDPSSSVIGGLTANGKTPDEAVKNLLKEMRGKLLVINSGLKSRTEFLVPDQLVYG